MGRCIGLDVHRDFCEIAIWQNGEVRRAKQVLTKPSKLMQFAQSLDLKDRVALESTSNALAIARLIKPHVKEVVIVNTRRLKAIAEAKHKTDRHDAKLLAQLLAAGMLEGAWLPDERTRALRRRVSRRARLVVHRTRQKNEVLAVLHRNLKRRPPMSDAFSPKGCQWLLKQELPADEQETIDACLRQLEFLNTEIGHIESKLAQFAVESADARRLMTVPGVGLVTSVCFLAQIGEISRFQNPQKLVGYLGLDPRVRQSGAEQAKLGHISKEGSALVRHVLVEAAHTAVRSPGPHRAFYERVRARRGHSIAIIAVARKMCVLFWYLLTHGEDYAHAMPVATNKKLRKVELTAGSPRRYGGGRGNGLNREQQRQLERQGAQAAQRSYERLVSDWHRQQKSHKAKNHPKLRQSLA